MISDLIIVKQIKQGERSLFSELVNRHQKSLMRLALRMTKDINAAEDIVQDSFIKAYQNLASFEERSSFKSWLFQITLNTAKNKLRSFRHEHINIDLVKLSVDGIAENEMVNVDLRSIIQNEIGNLPTKQKMALNMRIFEDMSFKEIAQAMNCPYDTAKANYRHALIKLRERFKENKLLNHWENHSGESLSGYLAEVEK